MRGIKKNYKIVLGIIIGILISGVVVYASNEILSSNISYDNSSSGLKSTDIKGAIDELYEKINNNKNTEIDIGDRVVFGTEKFYVLSVADDYVELLAMYNLKVGNNYGSNLDTFRNPVGGDGLGIQDRNCTGDSGNQLMYNGSSYVSVYFNTTTCTDWNSPDRNSYLTNYSTYLKNNLGIEIMQIRYPVSSDFISLGCTVGVDEGGNKMPKDCSKTGYTWLYSTNYFLGEKFYYSESYSDFVVIFRGEIQPFPHEMGSGHRPVIKIKKSLII